MRVIAVINQKGGVAKTTTTANLGHALALMGQKVTVIDLDPQGHLSSFLGVNRMDLQGIDSVLLNDTPITETFIQVRNNLTLVPAGSRLDSVEQMVEGRLSRSKLLKASIEECMADQDYVLIDCPPASGLLVIFALYASHEVLIPVNGDFLSLHGLSHFLGTLQKVESAMGHKVDMHIAITRLHPRRRLARSIVKKLTEYFPGKILATPIRETAALAECPSFGKTIFEYRTNSYSKADYESLAQDLQLRRVM
jgi:chromosome partitioning protein